MKQLILSALLAILLLLGVSCSRSKTNILPLPPSEAPVEANGETEKPNNSDNPEDPDIFAPGFKAPVSVEMPTDRYKSGEKIVYTFVNRKNSAVNILNIPILYKSAPNGNELISFSDSVGFCGTPDSIAANSVSLEWELDISYLFAEQLEPGRYILEFEVVDDNYEVIDRISCNFTIVSDIA